MKLGLCISGGGAKGSYESGVIKALYDRGINKFDSISGTSIGAIIGYFILTNNVEKLEDMWTNVEGTSANKINIVNNTVDNSFIINILKTLDDTHKEKLNFYVNYLKIENRNIEEVVVDVTYLDKKETIDSIKYSSLLPFNPQGKLPLKDQFIKDVNEDLYEGFKLDGGLVRNTLIEPLIKDNMDKIIVLSTRHDYKLPYEIKSSYDENNIIVVRPKTEFKSNDTLNFTNEFCSKMFKEGYEIGMSIYINN